MLGIGDKETLLSELTVHRGTRNPTHYTFSALTTCTGHVGTGVKGALVRKGEWGERKDVRDTFSDVSQS